jgi:hypothetical protein
VIENMALITDSTTVFGNNTNHVAIFFKNANTKHTKTRLRLKPLHITYYSTNTTLSCITASHYQINCDVPPSNI